jgi:DNA-binding XRE family transcriptional regulator
MAMTLKAARIIRGYTQEELAEMIGVSRSTYIKMEKMPDNITVGLAKAISKAVDVPLDDLFFARDST